ncbi:MAG: 1-acyl-sn-glycerol-3-phosphate acyltransferase [Salinivirgaceae bacterium]|nr:1-acyl-sn-glycerol-3-phosphate acyltransferase [Salinivirgaceae bacterium]MDD4745733.1 1-acyl-sn-glycerol-3-phosphate acyltransferase [Salinivirgaceae bacterium]MDY0279274.1 1-acyl-sn-glycerol-3-phosphate acyltransferase [Salinivirgaceae bacterium]
MGKHNIEKFSVGYQLLKYSSKILHDCLYSKIHVFNLPKIFSTPHLFALNHQNALMDAMAILYASERPLVFLARSDIFKNPTLAKILYFLKILPIFRIRDGFDALKNNDEIFKNTVRVLNHPRGLAILPEGNHEGVKKLRQLQKGFARIAFQTMESNENKAFMIIPTGIDYEDYENFGTSLIVNFGEPFDITEYFNVYKQNPAQGLTELRERLSMELKKLTIHIDSDRWYDTILFLTNLNRELGQRLKKEHLTVFNKSREIAEVLSKQDDNSLHMIDLETNCNALKERLKQVNQTSTTLHSKSELASLLFAFIIRIPWILLSIPGFVFYGWFFLLLRTIVTKKIKDPQFRTSVRFGGYIFGFLLLILIESLIPLFFFDGYIYPITILATTLSGFIGLKTFPTIKRILKSIKSSLLHLLGHKNISSAIEIKQTLIEQIIQIENRYDNKNEK